jgi:hypothetical protein
METAWSMLPSSQATRSDSGCANARSVSILDRRVEMSTVENILPQQVVRAHQQDRRTSIVT